MLEGPLEDLSISRPRSRLEWGVRVPGDDEQTVYVWFDALLVYLSGVGYPWAQGVGEERGWPADLQIVGKDIVRYVPSFIIIHSSISFRVKISRHIPPCDASGP